mmetsp:Transcript_66857/g.189756  ORF Transcript_66857/g.189756 Transcript_66857/m.189756 type:complete len:685 (+) Transcript_66857:47-2101(+)
MRLPLGVLALAAGVRAQRREHGVGCTAVAVDGRGSRDGSAYAGMNADCSSCDGRVAYVPAQEHPEGAMRPLYIFMGTAPRWVGYGRGSFYEPQEGQELSPKVGEVPEVRSTYAYWEAVLPLMNEKGLALGESSCAARLLNYPEGQAPAAGDPRSGKPATEGRLDLTNMMQIALERCETARCGVMTMGKMADEYGFFPMVGEWSLGLEADGKVAFADGGEAVTLADRTGEAWIFHVVGGVQGVSKSSWAAMRLPHGHAGFVANNFVLREVPLQPSEDWLFSASIRDVARAAGLWDGQEPLDFTRVFAPDTVTFQSPAGEAPIPLYGSLRQWRLLGLTAPKGWGKRKLPVDPLDLPVTVAAEQPLGRKDVFAFLSDLYEGTEFDMTQGILAGPFGNPFRLEGGYATTHLGQIPRGISISRTTYSFVGQSRPAAEPVAWLAPDTPATSVYVPFYPTAGGRLAPAYASGTLSKFSRDSAFWAFDFVANWASLANWRNASGQFVLPLRAQLQREIEQEMEAVEARAQREGPKVLGDWQVGVQQRVVDRWWQLADELVVAYNDGFFNDAKTNRIGLSLGYPAWWARQIGFNQDVHPIFVKRDPAAELAYLADPEMAPPGFQTSQSSLPANYNFARASWLSEEEQPRGASHLPLLLQSAVAACALLVGVAVGRVYERRKGSGHATSYAQLL